MEARTYELMRELEDEHWWFRARRTIIASVLGSSQLSGNSRILEIGCGTGGNLEMLTAFGDLTAVESDDAAARLANSREVVPVLSGFLPQGLPEFQTSFDLVALFDVIEHISDDGESLRTVSGLLRPGGKILLTVPAFNFLWSVHDEENHHQRRYRKADIHRLAETCKLNVDYISYFNFWLFPPVAAIRILRKVFPYRESWKDMALPPRWLNTMLERLFATERFVMGRFSLPFGMSLVAVLSKSD